MPSPNSWHFLQRGSPTLLLRDWLIDRAKEAGDWPRAAEVAAELSVEKPTLKDDAQIAREERERAQEELENAL